MPPQRRGRRFGPQRNRNAERFEHIRGAAPAGYRPVAVLGHRDPRRRRHQRRRRGDIEGARAVPARAAGVDKIFLLRERQRQCGR